MFSSIPFDVLRHIISLSGKTLKSISLCRGVCKNWGEALSIKAIQEFSNGIEYIECVELNWKNFNAHKSLLGSRTRLVCFDIINEDTPPLQFEVGKDISTSFQLQMAKLCPNLETLDDSLSTYSDKGVFEIVNSCPFLSSVNIWCAPEFTDYSLFALARCRTLKKFKIVNSHECSDDGFIALFRGCPNLESLSLHYIYDMTNVSLLEISKLKNLQTLHITYVNYGNLSDETLIKIAHGCPKLKSLQCPSSDNSLLEVIRLCPEITELGTIVSDVSLMAIADAYPNLEELIIYEGSRVSDSSLNKLFQKCPKLKRLLLNRCAIPNSLVNYLNLEYLSIIGCTMSTNFYDVLLNLKNIKELNIYKCHWFNEEFIRNIIKQCPSLKKIYTDTQFQKSFQIEYPNVSIVYSMSID